MPFGPVRAAEQNSSFTSSQPWIPWNCHENRAFAKPSISYSYPFVATKILVTARAQCISTSPNAAPLLLRKPCELPSSLSPPRRAAPHRRVARASMASCLLAQRNRLRSLCYKSILLSRIQATLRFHAAPPSVENRMPSLHCLSSAFALVRGNDK